MLNKTAKNALIKQALVKQAISNRLVMKKLIQKIYNTPSRISLGSILNKRPNIKKLLTQKIPRPGILRSSIEGAGLDLTRPYTSKMLDTATKLNQAQKRALAEGNDILNIMRRQEPLKAEFKRLEATHDTIEGIAKSLQSKQKQWSSAADLPLSRTLRDVTDFGAELPSRSRLNNQFKMLGAMGPGGGRFGKELDAYKQLKSLIDLKKSNGGYW